MQAGGKESCVTFTSKRGSVRTLAAADLLGDWFISPDGLSGSGILIPPTRWPFFFGMVRG